MAAYSELHDLFTNADLRNKVRVAVIVAADTIRTEPGATPNNANRLIWAKWAFENPARAADQMLKAVLAANNSAAIGAITGASDSLIQSNIDAAVDIFADGTQKQTIA